MDKILQQFLSIAESGSFSRAAQLLNVTQPTLTFNIRKLEENLGVTLFKRTARGVTLTPYGMTLFENVRVMRRLYDNTIDLIERQRMQTERSISIGTGYTWWVLFLRDWAFEHRRLYPEAPVHVSIGNQLRCMDQLLAGEISMFVGHETPSIAAEFNTRFVPFCRARQGYFVREGHPLLGEPRRREDIQAYPRVSPGSPDQRYERLFLRQPDGEGSPRYRIDGHGFASNSMSACIDYMLHSDGVLRFTTLLADKLVEKGLREVALLPSHTNPLENVGIYATQDADQNPRTAALIDEIRALGLARFDVPDKPNT
ncbi:LysR family transcriptional regulator [Martelella endophytica]|uniref:LysR family transcriptional regulator n=1 Tax=Martelella endophytica TaxID=1486262 RepID=UPI000697AC63|nr:LysR family transcriptional regulator [Martelella endophytica]